jgi:uncharacterized protein (TIGR00255 family)
MTGFGIGEASGPSGRLVTEARSVNHRFLDVRVKLPREMSEHVVYVEQLVRARLGRGRVDITVHCEGCVRAPTVLDRARALAAMRDFQAVADALGYEERAPLSLLAMVPDLFVQGVDRDPEQTRAALRSSLDRALDDLEGMREREGAALATDLQRRLDVVVRHTRSVHERVDGMTDRLRLRFRERLERLLEGVRVDATRFEQEVAILADHADISEELTRLECHCVQLARLFEEREPVGRRIDFLLQEMAREVNTIGSKSSEGEVAVAVIELKAEIERMREQAQNIE